MLTYLLPSQKSLNRDLLAFLNLVTRLTTCLSLIQVTALPGNDYENK